MKRIPLIKALLAIFAVALAAAAFATPSIPIPPP
jgi:hypothetical protein